MKQHNLITILLFFYLTACAPQTGITTPEPEELVTDARYAEQIKQIDQERAKENKESISELVAEDRLTKVPNGTEPIVVEIEQSQTMDQAKEDAENGILDVVHDKVQIEEYFVIPTTKEFKTNPPETLTTDESDDTDTDTDTDPTPINYERSNLDETSNNIEVGLSDSEPDVDQPVLNVQTEITQPQSPHTNGSAPLQQSTTPKILQKETPNTNETEKPRTETIEKKEKETILINLDTKRASPTADFNPKTAVSKSSRPKQRPKGLKEKALKNSIKSISKYKARWDINPNGHLYTRYVLDALDKYGKKLFDARIDDSGYCRNINTLSKDQKKQLWLMFISGIARWESGFDPSAKYREPKSGKYSRGLLQLDYRWRKSYKCNLNSEYDLNDPQKNLECGVKMVTKLVTRDKLIRGFKWIWVRKKNKNGSYAKDENGKYIYIKVRQWLGAADFWSVLRPEIWSGSKKRNVLTIPGEVKKLSFCR